jgi:hypothetical protein
VAPSPFNSSPIEGEEDGSVWVSVALLIEGEENGRFDVLIPFLIEGEKIGDFGEENRSFYAR